MAETGQGVHNDLRTLKLYFSQSEAFHDFFWTFIYGHIIDLCTRHANPAIVVKFHQKTVFAVGTLSANNPSMKFSLTKDKTVEINLPKWLSASKRSNGLRDVVGIEFNSGNPQGCPAVRLVAKGNGYAVSAAGFIPPPDGVLPEKWEEMPHQPIWVLPSFFQGPHAAISVCSPDMFLRQTTLDVLAAAGEATTAANKGPAAPGGKLALKPLSKKVPVPAKAISEADLFQPVSANGTRSIAVPLDEKPFILEAGLPEYQVLWLSRLLPEGKRPTAASIQIVPASALAAVLSLPDFVAAGGTALVVFVFRSAIVFAGYREGSLLLFRECPGASGYEAIRTAVKNKLGLEENLVDSVLDDTLIDPRSALEPFVRPVLQQVEISLDYLARRHSLKISKVFLLGLPSGAHYWSQLAQESLRLPFLSPSLFDGLSLPTKADRMPSLTASQSQTFLAALGAARAAMEVRP